MIYLGRYNTDVWNHSNQTICSTFTVNKSTLGRRSKHIQLLLWKHQQDSFLKDKLVKYDVWAG